MIQAADKMLDKNGKTSIKNLVIKVLLLCLLTLFSVSSCEEKGQEYDNETDEEEVQKPVERIIKDIQLGAYFFDGWSGINSHANDPDQAWAKNAPTHLTRRLAYEFSDRKPIWGWRGDSQAIVETQINLAVDHGLDFFLFCWYWRNNQGPINPAAIENDSKHTQLGMYLKAKNKHLLKFALLVANHAGAEIVGPDNWEAAARYWMKYFKDEQHVTIDGKPLVVIFNSSGIDKESIARMQQVAIDNGFPGLAIAGCGNPASDVGFTHRTHYNIVPGYSAGSEEHAYSELVEAHKSNWTGTEKMPYIPEVTVGWDKRPWEGPDGLGTVEGWYYTDRTPRQVENFIQDAITWMDNNPTKTTKERMILLYAWNENGEGGYLVPTAGDPDGEFLKAVKRVAKDRERPPVNVTGVSITEEQVTIGLSRTKTLRAIVKPDNATYKNIRWSSSNPQVASINNLTGEITAKALGEATITVTTVEGEKTATSSVKVLPAFNLNSPLDKTSLTLDPTDSEANTNFSWSPLENATKYILKMSLSENFSSPLYEKEVNGSSITVSSYEFNEMIKNISEKAVKVYWTVEPKDPIQVVGETRYLSVTADQNEYLRLSPASAINLSVSKGAGEYQYAIVAGSGTSSINTVPLTVPLDQNSVIASIMIKNSTVQSTLNISLIKANGTEVGSVVSSEINASTTWQESAIKVTPLLTGSSWGEAGDYVRLSFSGSGQVEVNALHFRPMNYQENKDSYVPEMLKLVSNSSHALLETVSEYHFKLTSTGADPFATTNKLSASLPSGACMLSFEYKSNARMENNFQLFFGIPGQELAEARSLKLGAVAASPEWNTYRADLTSAINNWNWGVAGSYIRMDIGEKAGYEIEIRNIKIVFKD